MDSADEGATRVTLPEVRSLHNLLKVTEELLFSFPLSADLVRKYEMLREGAFMKAGLIHSASKIRRMQKEAHAQQRTTVSPKETQTDNRASTPPPSAEVQSFKFSELESRANVIRFELIARLESAHDMVRQYQQLLNFILSSLTNEANRFGDLIDHGTVIKYPPIRITEVNRGIDITPERELTVEELELEQPRLVQWFQRLEEDHKAHLEAFKEDFDDRNAKFSLLLQHIAERYEEQNECITGLEEELRALNEHSTEVIGELKGHVGALTQEIEVTKEQKDKEMREFKATLAKQTEKSIYETKKTFESELERLVSERERSLKTMTESEKAVMTSRISALEEIENIKRTHTREMEEIRVKWEETVEKERRQHRKDIAQREDEEMQREREWKAQRRRLEEELSKAKQGPIPETTVMTETKTVQTMSDSVHFSLQSPVSQLLPELQTRLSPFYQKHSAGDKAWAQSLPRRREDLHVRLSSLAEHVELVLAVEFAVYFGGKMATDNAWLVERLTEFGKDNEKLRLAVSAPPKAATVYISPAKPAGKLHKQVWEDIRATAATLREFEEARDQLLRKLQGSR